MSISVISGNTLTVEFVVTNQEIVDEQEIPQEVLENMDSYKGTFDVFEYVSAGSPIKRITKSLDTLDFKRGSTDKLNLFLRPDDTRLLSTASKYAYVLDIFKTSPIEERYTLDRGEFIIEPKVK